MESALLRQAMIRPYSYGMPPGISSTLIGVTQAQCLLWHGRLMESTLPLDQVMAIRMGWIIACGYGISPQEIRSIFIMVNVTLYILWRGHQTAHASSLQAGVAPYKCGRQYKFSQNSLLLMCQHLFREL